jgi:hypothetical protein
MSDYREVIDNKYEKITILAQHENIVFELDDKKSSKTYKIIYKDTTIVDDFNMSYLNYCRIVKYNIYKNTIHVSYKNNKAVLTFHMNSIIELSVTATLDSVDSVEQLDELTIVNDTYYDQDIVTIIGKYSCLQKDNIIHVSNYVLHHFNRSVKILISPQMRTHIFHTPINWYDDGAYDIQIYCNDITFNKKLKTVSCHHIIFDFINHNLIENLPIGVKTLEFKNDDVLKSFLSIIDTIDLKHVNKLILHKVKCDKHEVNVKFLALPIKEIYLLNKSTFTNYDCLNGKINVINDFN